MKTFYVRVTTVNTKCTPQQIGLVGQSEDSGVFLNRIKGIFPPDGFTYDDLHVLAPLEVFVVHPSCKGVLSDDFKSIMVDADKPLLISIHGHHKED